MLDTLTDDEKHKLACYVTDEIQQAFEMVDWESRGNKEKVSVDVTLKAHVTLGSEEITDALGRK